MILSDLHSHSVFSDGDNTPEEMIAGAIGKGLSSYGLSDHSYTAEDESYCMKKESLSSYLAACREAKKRFEGRIEFVCGLEKDALSEADPEKFDYLIGSVHYVKAGGAVYPVDEKEGQEAFLKTCGDRMELARRYFDAVARHVQSAPFDLVGHFDVIAKYGLFDDADPLYQRLALEALEEVLKSGRILEVNTGGMSRAGRKTPYPDPFLLRFAARHGARCTLSGDAHSPDGIACRFEETAALLKDCGFSSLTVFSGGAFREVKIDETKKA